MLLSDIGLTIPLFHRGAAGVPTTNLAVPDLAGRCEGYEQTIAAHGGFESMTLGFAADLDEALDIFNTWLGRSTVVSGPDAEVAWEGQLTDITLTIGQRRRAISLERMANRVRCRYTTDTNNTTAVTSPTSDTASIAMYGTKDAVVPASNVTAATASGLAARALAQWKDPQQQPSTRIATGEHGPIKVDLRFRGWYWTLGWVVTSRTSTTTTATNSQIAALIATSGVGIGVTNPFLSTSGFSIGSPGVSPSEFIAPETTYLEKLEDLSARGNDLHRWVLMCLEDREIHFKQWAGSSPTTIHYIAGLGDHQVMTPNGVVVAPWNVRPDTMYQEVDFLNAASVVGADDATRQYAEREICSISGNRIGVTIEPQASGDLDVLLRGIA